MQHAPMQAILNKFAGFQSPPLEGLSPENARKLPSLKNAVEEMSADHLAVRAMTLSKPMPEPVGKIRHVLIPGPESPLLARVFTPKGRGPFPVLVYFHGGGWVIANLDVYEPSCRALCNAAGCIVVSVAYRQAPEHRYPAAAEDAHAALQWVIANAGRLGGDPRRVAVGGESAGGNLAAVACLKARDEGGAMPVAQVLIYPMTDHRMNTPSYRENADAKPLNAAMLPWFWKHYLGSEGDGNQAYASPLQAESLRGLSAAIVITAEIDPLRDEGEAYAERLAASGVPVRAVRYEGVTHDFFGLTGLVPQAKAALAEVALGLKLAFA